jgi:hypothetical protein
VTIEVTFVHSETHNNNKLNLIKYNFSIFLLESMIMMFSAACRTIVLLTVIVMLTVNSNKYYFPVITSRLI